MIRAIYLKFASPLFSLRKLFEYFESFIEENTIFQGDNALIYTEMV